MYVSYIYMHTNKHTYAHVCIVWQVLPCIYIHTQTHTHACIYHVLPHAYCTTPPLIHSLQKTGTGAWVKGGSKEAVSVVVVVVVIIIIIIVVVVVVVVVCVCVRVRVCMHHAHIDTIST